MNLTITDYTGTLSADPQTWPAELKRAIEQCCCSQSSSSSGTQSSLELIQSGCCTTLLPSLLKGNIRNTTSHDTGLQLRFTPPNTRPAWIPVEAWPTIDPGNVAGAWASDLVLDFEKFVDIQGPFQGAGFPLPPPMGQVHFRYKLQVYYYATMGLVPLFENPTTCPLHIFQVVYPNGEMNYTYPAGNGYPAADITYPITWKNNIAGAGLGFGSSGGVGGVGVSIDGSGGCPSAGGAIGQFTSTGCPTRTLPCYRCSPFLNSGNLLCDNGSLPGGNRLIVSNDHALFGQTNGQFSCAIVVPINPVFEKCRWPGAYDPTGPLIEVFQ